MASNNSSSNDQRLERIEQLILAQQSRTKEEGEEEKKWRERDWMRKWSAETDKRLSELEEKDTTKTKKIKKLKEMMKELEFESWKKTDLIKDLQESLKATKENHGTLEKSICCNQHLDQEDIKLLKREEKSWESLDNTQRSLISKVSELEKNEQALKNYGQAMREEMVTMGERVKLLDEKTQETQEQLKDLKKNFMTGQDDVQETLNKMRKDAEKFETLAKITKTVENRFTQFDQSITNVLLRPPGRLVSGRYIKMDQCYRVDKNSAWFDEASCCLVPQEDSVCVMCVWFRQNGKGDIQMNYKIEGDGIYYFAGRTGWHDELVTFVEMLNWKKGKKVWLEARCNNGTPTIDWCRLMWWRVC